MSSRELLELIEGMSGDSWFKQSLNAALRRAKIDAEREAMYAAHAEIQSYLTGEARIPHEMALSVIEKREPTGVR